TLSEPEPVTTPSRYAAYFSFSRDGAKMTFAAGGYDSNVHRIAFDPVSEKVVGQDTAVTRGTTYMAAPSSSPDGKWVLFNSSNGQENLLLAGPDGSDIKKLTDDPIQDRDARWMPDGSIIFQSTRSHDVWQMWSIKPDGSELKQITKAPDPPFGSGV